MVYIIYTYLILRLLSNKMPSSVDAVGLQLSDADLLIVLMRSLPDAVKSYTIHHSHGETYQSYRSAARRWEMQQRLFLEQMGSSGSKDRRVNEVSCHTGGSVSEGGSPNTEWFSIGDDFGQVHSVSHEKCQKCGSRKHSTPNCQIDLSKTKCFRCQQFGHVGMNCPSGKGSKGSSGSQSVSKGKGKVNKGGQWDKGKGKSKKGKGSKGFGKKGKLNQVEAHEDDWWYSDDWAYDWTDSDWNWNVDQVDWGDWDWWSQQNSGHEGSNENPPESSSENKPEVSVGSLVIHALTCDTRGCETAIGHLCLLSDSEDRELGSHDVSGFSQTFDFSQKPESVSNDFCFGFGSKEATRRHMSFFPGLMHHDEGVHRSGDDFDVAELLSPDPKRFVLWRPQFSTSWSHPDSLDGAVEFSKYLEHVCPILSELSCSSDAGWWLLDSGAAVTVVSESHFPLFQAKLLQSPDVDRFRAANGSKVMMKGVANIVLGFSMLDSKTGKSSWKTATLQAMVGNTNHNILSTTALCRSGWQFSQWDGGAELRRSATGDVLSGLGLPMGPYASIIIC